MKQTANCKKLRLKDFKEATKVRPLEYLTDKRNVELAILDCLQENDDEGIIEVIEIYTNALKKKALKVIP